jgi:hypothetical protein
MHALSRASHSWQQCVLFTLNNVPSINSVGSHPVQDSYIHEAQTAENRLTSMSGQAVRTATQLRIASFKAATTCTYCYTSNPCQVSFTLKTGNNVVLQTATTHSHATHNAHPRQAVQITQ